MKRTYGIMQGRLTPPSDNKMQSFPKVSWREEFEHARRVGLAHIEWIFEADECNKNPLWTEDGIEEIRAIIGGTGIRVHSVCADYFMDVPYMRASEESRSELRDRLVRLVVQTSRIGARYIDLPFVDASKIDGPHEFDLVKELVAPALSKAESLGVTVALETSLSPEHFRALIEFISHPCLAANYDSGNSASLGYNCAEELASYGKWIKTVHIKDRKLHGSTVPLGTGNADLPRLFRSLLQGGYSGPFVFQAAREGDELDNARRNIQYVDRLIESIEIS